MIESDFIVIGSGAAGLSAALHASKHGSVAMITKKGALDSNSNWAQGGIACVTAGDDSIEKHVSDTLIAGAGLCNEKAVRTIVSEGPERIEELLAWGVDFDQREAKNGHLEFDLTREGGHSERRVLHAADATGREITEKLLAQVQARKNITIYENHYAIDLITTAKLGLASEDRILGVYVLDEESGEVITMRSDRVILATGGCGRVYMYTTNPMVATGDGVAMAWRAGATISNMEFIQFHPTCLYHPQKRSFLITEAMRGEGARLIDKDGVEFMPKYDKRGSLAPRDIVARAIDHEIKRLGLDYVHLDISHQPPEFVKGHFPTIYEKLLGLGIDMTRQPIPVVPAQHYTCGGIVIDLDGRTDLPGLYAAGECTESGLHGANRLASNSLLECFVFGEAAAAHILDHWDAFDAPPPVRAWDASRVTNSDEEVIIKQNWTEIRRFMWNYVGIVRTTKRLERAQHRINLLTTEIQAYYGYFRLTSGLIARGRQ